MAEEAIADLRHTKVLPTFLWARLFDPMGTREVYEALARIKFGMAEECAEISLLVNLCDRSGQPCRALARMRHVLYGDGEYSSTMLSVIPLHHIKPCYLGAWVDGGGADHYRPASC